MRLLSALQNRDNPTWAPPEPPTKDLIVDSVVVATGLYERDMADLLRMGFRKGYESIERDRDEWKKKAGDTERALREMAQLRADMLEMRGEMARLLAALDLKSNQ